MTVWRTLSVATLLLGLLFGSSPGVGASIYFTKSDDKGAGVFEAGMDDVARGHFADAVRAFETAVKADPKNADYFSRLGYSYRKSGDYDGAFENYLKALSLDPTHRGAHEYVGEAYVETGNLAMADQHFARLADLCPLGCSEYDDLAEFRRDHAGPAPE
jgi:tetratricopeptide (TPR) repeat protein